MTHATTEVVDCFDRTVAVDVAMVPLLRAMWARTWETTSSCQGPGRSFAHGELFAHVTFGSAYDAAEFSRLCGRPLTATLIEDTLELFRHEQLTPYDAMFSNYETTKGRKKKTLWEVKCMFVHYPSVGATVFFEADDLKAVTRALGMVTTSSTK